MPTRFRSQLIDMPCPSCGESASGKFCSNCGASLANAPCGACGVALSAGARFCHACGAATGGAPRAAAGSGPWIIAGAAVVALLVVLAIARLNPGASPAPAPIATGARPAPDISQMSPRERADRLFNRVVSAAERGATDTVAFFKPMALEAYRLLGDLDNDARYHVGLIHLVSADYAATVAQADSIGLRVSTHLFAAILRAEAADAQGDAGALRSAREAFLRHYEAERAAGRPEYDEHPGLLDRFRTQVLQALGQPAEN